MLFKVLEALMAGKATVGFKEAYRGIPNTDNRVFVSVKSDREFIGKVLEIVESDEKNSIVS
jgi:hypothetical protein